MALSSKMKFGVFMAPFHRVGENPTLALERDLELLQWLIFTLVALSFAVTGSGVNGLRRSLAVKNQALADALEQVRDLAIRDDLTGLFNRRHILEVLEHQKALADNQIYPFSVCYVDLDHFKRINDEYGHDMGDRVLRQFAEHTLDNLREGDYLARLGGEEFILVLPQSDLAGAELVAVGCPQCTAMLEGVVEPRPQIKDIAELVADVLLETPAPAKKPATAKPEALEVH